MYDDRALAIFDLHDGVSGTAPLSDEDSDTTTQLQPPLIHMMELQLAEDLLICTMSTLTLMKAASRRICF